MRDMPDARTVDAVLAVARSRIGITENPAGSNRNPFGASYHHDGEPWCAYFVSACFRDAGVPLPSLEPWMPDGYSYVPDAVSYAMRSLEYVASHDAVRPGDIVCYDWEHNGTADHTGIVTAADGAGVRAIEGNTSRTGSQSNGGQVLEQDRPWSTVALVWRPAVNLPPEADDMPGQFMVTPSTAVPGLWVKVRPEAGGAVLRAWFAEWDDPTADEGAGTSVLDVARALNKPLVGRVWVGQDPQDDRRFVVSDDNGDYAFRLR